MKTRDTEYLYATTRIRSLEKGLLDQSAVDRLVEASGIEDMAKIMSELGYTNLQVAGIREIEESLLCARRDTFALLSEISPNSELCEIFRLRYDYHNIKAILKSMTSGEDYDGLLIDAGRFSTEFLATALREMDYRELPIVLQKAIEDARDTLSRTNVLLLDFEKHRQFKDCVRDLNHLYLKTSPFYEIEDSWDGFRWIAADDNEQNIIVFRRIDSKSEEIIVVCNFSPITRENYKIGVPYSGIYTQIFSTDDEKYGGKGIKNPVKKSKKQPYHAEPYSIELIVPGMSAMYFRVKQQRTKKDEVAKGKNKGVK